MGFPCIAIVRQADLWRIILVVSCCLQIAASKESRDRIIL